jgi:endonuclease/exonuclease/phosphatase family metal-dependent hydrolase
MKRILMTFAVFLAVCSAVLAQKVKIRSEKAEDHVLSIMSFNIRHGKGMDGKVDLNRIAREISLVQPDVVALQEVDKETKRVDGVDLPKVLARMAGEYAGFFAPAMDYDGGKYGNAILTKKAPLDMTAYPLPGKEEPRVLLLLEFDDYYFCSVHMSLDSASRVEACRKLAQIAKKGIKPDKLFFVAGDFNMVPNSVEMRVLSESFSVLSPFEIKTFPSDNPDRTLDYILVYRGGAGKSFLKKLEKGKLGIASWVQPEKVASDHRPVFVVISKSDSFVSDVVGE